MVIKRWLPRIVALALVAGGVVLLLVKKPWAKGATPITYTTVTVGRGNIAAQVTANGTLSARGTVLVGAQVSGRVVEIHADFNDTVKKGQIIAKIDTQVLQAQIQSAQAAVALAHANANKAQVAVMDTDRQYKRQKLLQDQQLVAGATVEGAEVAHSSSKASLTASRAQVAQAQANLAQAKLQLSYATIYSPVDGVVLSRAVDVGQTVAASLSAPTLFTIAEDLARMQINTAVAEADVGRLTEGMKAQFTVDAFPGKTFDGIVRQVRNAPTTTSGVVTYDAVIDVDNTDKSLRPGMTANVTFVLQQVADAVKIPNAALRFKPTREQMQAMRGESAGERGSGERGGGRRGSGGRQGRGSDGSGGSGQRAEGAGSADAGGGGGGPRGGGGGRRDFGDRKPVWKLVDDQPKMVLIKPGLTDGSTTQLVEGELEPGDLLITEVQGVAAPARKTGAF
ncbi:MAG: efflux RND transporter periplasmic adaptor subunit [Deltaproteobacteria bacterium]|nr:efflux RND transporter periplasmic adaptor subunit [Deltaproteobacteria bacterium]